MRLLVIPIAAVALWPVYSWLSHHSGSRRAIRILLGVIFAIQAVFVVPIVWNLPGLLRRDVGRFDDAMLALVALSTVTLLLSIAILVLGELAVALEHRRRRQSRANNDAGA